MRILFVGKDTDLVKRLRLVREVEDVLAVSKQQVENLPEAFDLAIVSDREVAHHELDWLKGILNKGSANVQLVYLISYTADTNYLKDSIFACEQSGYHYVPPKRSIDQIQAEITRRFFGANDQKNEGDVITFFSTHRQTGLTSTVLSIADELSKNLRESVCVLGLNAFNPGDSFLNYTGKYLDDLYTQIRDNRVLQPSDLKANMQHINDFYYLAGNSDITKKYRYSSDAIDYLIECARQAFDIVLIDAGADPDNNLCLQALLHANMKIVLTTQQSVALKMWSQFKRLFGLLKWEDGRDSYFLLVNKMDPALGDVRNLEKSMEMMFLASIPDLYEAARECEMDSRLLTTISEKEYKKTIQGICKQFQSRFDWTEEDTGNAKRSWFRKGAGVQ